MSWYNNLKIISKMMFGFAIVDLIMVFISYYGIINIKSTDDNYTKMYTYHGAPLGNLAKAAAEFQKIRLNATAAILYYDDSQIQQSKVDQIEQSKLELKKNLDIIDRTLTTVKGRELFNKMMDSYEVYSAELDKTVKLATEKKFEEAKKAAANAAALSKNTSDAFDNLINLKATVAGKLSEEYKDNTSSTMVTMIIISILCVVISLGIGFTSAKVINRPLQELVQKVNLISNGNLNIPKSTYFSKDEIGNLVVLFEKMTDSLRKLVGDTLSKSNQIAHSSQTLMEISQASASSSTELSAQSSTAASSSEQISANVSSVATAAEEMGHSIREISKNTTTFSKLSHESESKALVANEMMKKLGESSQQIGNIIKTINNIAEQTNLLALNATIEAARAGEAGKGFAVVANEVKELAKESAKATEEITGMISTIQNDSTNAINAIEEIIENVKEVNSISDVISSAIEEQSITTSEITRNLSEASKGVNAIVEVVGGISDSSQSTAEQANALKSSSEELADLAAELEKNISSSYRL